MTEDGGRRTEAGRRATGDGGRVTDGINMEGPHFH
jgi:hypothetical protein